MLDGDRTTGVDIMATAEPVDLGKLTDALASTMPVKARDLAERMGAEYTDVRDALIRLEKMGIVYRTGKTRGTRWWLG